MAEAPQHSSEALIYVPGLALGFTPHKTPRGLIDRVARAMDAQAEATATFAVEWKEPIFGDGRDHRPAAVIQRTDDGATEPVVDVYVYEWAGRFKDRWESQNLFTRALRTALGLLGAPKFVRFFNTSGRKTPFGRMQLALAAVAVAVLVAYAAVLLVALGQLAYQTVHDVPAISGPVVVTEDEDKSSPRPAGISQQTKGKKPGDKERKQAPAGDEQERAALTLSQWLALIGAAATALLPGLRRRVSQLGATLAAASSYLRVARDQPSIVGGLEQMIAKMNDHGRYQHIRVVSYSFGAIVALDTVFPTSSPPPRSLEHVDKLVTIGCPFEFATAVRKNWLAGRKNRPGVPANWLNIYSPVDLLGSDFVAATTSDAAEQPAQVAMVADADDAAVVTPTRNHAWDLGVEPSWGNLIEFYGFSSHGMYWGTDKEADHNVFIEVVEELYGGTPILR